MKFKDKVVLITGASRGIGMATALHFGKEGAIVIVNYLNSEEKANKVVEHIKKIGGNAIAIKCDVSKEEDVINMINITIKTFGKIDILVNNAGIIINNSILDRTVYEWNKVINTNLLGTFLCSKYLVNEVLKSKTFGKIINISSINGTKTFSPDQIDYDISKAGIITLTKDFARAFAPNIIVNAIAPGNVNTETTKINSFDNYEEDIKNIYLSRFGEMSEIVKIILFLASNESNYINGTVIYVDGGFSC